MPKAPKRVQFTVLNQDINVMLNQKRRGVYWSFKDVPQKYGPFKNEGQAINDAKLYSQYGTTNKTLLSRRSR
tara:strand:+ start:480 stop:695 length:216 start_codon:yes stop_codon:yes gene_type:complete